MTIVLSAFAVLMIIKALRTLAGEMLMSKNLYHFNYLLNLHDSTPKSFRQLFIIFISNKLNNVVAFPTDARETCFDTRQGIKKTKCISVLTPHEGMSPRGSYPKKPLNLAVRNRHYTLGPIDL